MSNGSDVVRLCRGPEEFADFLAETSGTLYAARMRAADRAGADLLWSQRTLDAPAKGDTQWTPGGTLTWTAQGWTHDESPA